MACHFQVALGMQAPASRGFRTGSSQHMPAYKQSFAARFPDTSHAILPCRPACSMVTLYTASVACGPPGSSPECPNRHAFSLEGCLDVEDQAIILLWLRSEAPSASSSSSSGEIAACISFQVCARSFRGKVSVGTRSGLQQCHPGQTCCPLFC